MLSVRRSEHVELPDKSAVHIFESVTLVHDDVLPVESLQSRTIAAYDLVRRDNDRNALARLASEMLAHQFGTLVFASVVHEDGNFGRPLLKFGHPVGEGTQGHDDQMRSPSVLVPQVCHERDDLYRFSETHFVGEDSVEAILPESYKPLEAINLVVAKDTPGEAFRLKL